jgi:hypothetical protein
VHKRQANAVPPEARTGLDPWTPADLPVAPDPRGLQWIGVVGPGVIVLGAAIGSGEFLLGPATYVKYGLTLLWVVGLAAILQTIFNLELMRYTMATGEPVISGFMRTRPSAGFWAWTYAVLYFLQIGWPGWAGAAAGAVYFLVARRLAGPEEAGVIHLIGVGTFLLSVVVLLFGRRIERTLEVLNWILVAVILGTFALLCLRFVHTDIWLAAAAGFIGLDPATGRFEFLPEGADWFLIGAFAGYAGGGGVANLTLSNWARDKGYGMAHAAGYIPAAVGGGKLHLAHSGFIFNPTPDAMKRWQGWWRIVAADQWGVFFVGVMLGMVLPGLLYLTFVPRGSDIRGLAVAAELAVAMAARGALLGGVIALLGVWILFKTQLDLLEGMVRAITDIIWTGSRRVRAWRGGDVRVIYYLVLAVVVAWGIVALGLTQPIILLQLSANMAGIVFIISSIHLLILNCTLLPAALRPPMWRRAALIAMALFYGLFAFLWIGSLF